MKGRFKIEESFLKGKGDECKNEDGIIITDYYAAVIDGVTSKTDFKWKGKTSGKIAMELTINAICHLPIDASVDEAIKIITEAIHQFYQQNQLLHEVIKSPERRLTANAVIYSSYRNEVWQIGDCQCIVGCHRFLNKKRIDRIATEVRSLYNQLSILKGISVKDLMEHDLGRNLIFPILREQAIFQNNPDKRQPNAYPALDGFPVRMDLVNILPINENKSIILSSDGYPKLCTTLDESEKYLSKILKEDPLCIKKFKSTKGLQKGNDSFDDRAYLKIVL